jgi:hypothetical protein
MLLFAHRHYAPIAKLSRLKQSQSRCLERESRVMLLVQPAGAENQTSGLGRGASRDHVVFLPTHTSVAHVRGEYQCRQLRRVSDGRSHELPCWLRWDKMTRMSSSWPRIALLHLRGRSTSTNPSRSSGRPNSPNVANINSSYLTDLLKDAREELGRADSKAALLLAATGVAVGALLAGLLGGQWTPLHLDERVEWIWWLGVASAAAGIFSIAAAVYPRIRRRGAPSPGTPTYYGDVAKYSDIDEFRRAVGQATNSQERLIDQIFLVSKIVQHKYVLLRRGLLFLLTAILACAAAVIINIPLNR